MTRDLEIWGLNVGEEVRKSFSRLLKEGFFDRYLSGDHILDIGYKGYLDDVQPILPHAIGVDMNYPGYDGKTLPFPDESQDAVFSSHALEHISDYRSTLAEWFRVLKVGGHLVTNVPHQYLYERSAYLPSRFNADHKRFYTPASLLAEVEEALDPFSYRVRFLEDNDRDFDYSIEPERHAGGAYEITLVLEKIARPAWADTVFERKPVPSLVQSILVMNLVHRGDFAVATESFRQIRRDFPQAALTLVCGPWNQAAAEGLQIFDEIISFAFCNEDGSSGAPLTQELKKEFRERLGGRRFDLAVDFRIDANTRSLLQVVDAKWRAGFGTNVQFSFLDIALPISIQALMGGAEQFLFPASQFKTEIGAHCGSEILLDHTVSRGMRFGPLTRLGRRLGLDRWIKPSLRIADGSYSTRLVYGPWAALPRGTYTIEHYLKGLSDTPDFYYDICITRSGRVDVISLGDILFVDGRAQPISFQLDSDVTNMELRLWARSEIIEPFRFSGAYFQKHGVTGGIHQSEAFAMLTNLMRMRMQYPRSESSIELRPAGAPHG